MNKTGALKKIVGNYVNKNGSEKTKTLYKEFSELKENAPGYHVKWKNLFTSMMEDVDKIPAQGAEIVSRKPKNLMKKFKNILTSLTAHKWGRKGIIGFAGSVVTGFAGLLIGLKLQKSASRAGRYTAKRELEKDPRNFIGYTQEEYEEVKDVKNPQKPGSKIKEYAMFIPTVIKQYYAYEKYKNNELKENKLLQEQLQKQDVTEEQLRDAKNLQKKLFNTFEKVDDNSQTYSESMEAAVDIAQPMVVYGGLLTMISPFIYIGAQIKKGKISGAKVLDKVTGFFSKSSEKLKSKWFKKYLSNVEKNIPHKVQGTNATYKPAAVLMQGIDFQKDSVSQIVSKAFKNLRNSTTELRKLPETEQNHQLYNFRETLKSYLILKDKNMAEKIDKILEKINWTDADTRADMLDILLNPQAIKNMPKENYDKAYKQLRYIIEQSTGSKKIETFYSSIHEILKDIPFDDIEKEISKLYDEIPQLKDFISKNKTDCAIKTLKEAIKEPDKSMFEYNINNMIDNLFSQKHLTEAVATIEKLSNTIKDFPEMANRNPALSGFLGMLKSQTIPVNNNILVELKKLNIDIKPVNGQITIGEALTAAVKAKDKVKAFTIRDLYKNMPEQFRDPKKSLKSFKAHIEKLTDEEFAQQMENIGFSSMNKETMLKILPKVEKILDNIPKEEIQKIWTTLIKEFNEHPDEFIKLVKTGKIANILMTPGLKKALAAVGISWTVFTLAITYAIESWLADMQLKAGRLGVMKAIESLEDPRYYANVEPAEQKDKPEIPPALEAESNLLAKIKK